MAKLYHRFAVPAMAGRRLCYGGMFAIDVREALSPAATGKAQWVKFFTQELLRRNVPLRLLCHDVAHPWLAGADVLHFSGMQHRGLRWHARAARAALAAGLPYVSPTSYIVPAFAPSGLRTITIVHDLIAFGPEPHELRARLIERCTLPLAVRRTALLCTVSDATKHDLVSRYPFAAARTSVIGSGPVDDPAPAAATFNPAYTGAVLCIGTLSPRKNQLRLAQAHAQLPLDLRERHPLVLVGKRGWRDAETVRFARNTPYIHWMGFLPSQQVADILSSAAVLAYPSLYEGFGMPLLTAFSAGVPALTAAGGSLAEVAGDAALIVDPYSVAALRDGLLRLLTDEPLRATLRNRGAERAQHFTWASTVDAFLEAARAKRLLDR